MILKKKTPMKMNFLNSRHKGTCVDYGIKKTNYKQKKTIDTSKKNSFKKNFWKYNKYIKTKLLNIQNLIISPT